jgi:hypothetical protein
MFNQAQPKASNIFSSNDSILEITPAPYELEEDDLVSFTTSPSHRSRHLADHLSPLLTVGLRSPLSSLPRARPAPSMTSSLSLPPKPTRSSPFPSSSSTIPPLPLLSTSLRPKPVRTFAPLPAIEFDQALRPHSRFAIPHGSPRPSFPLFTTSRRLPIPINCLFHSHLPQSRPRHHRPPRISRR